MTRQILPARTRRFVLFSFALLSIIVIVSSVAVYRTDLSPDRQYSLSPYSRETIESLDSSLVITWYLSRDFERMTPAIRYIKDFLEEYRIAGSGKILVSAKDPSLTGNVQTIEKLGIVPRQTGMRNKDGEAIKNFYSGLLVEYRGEYRVIPFLLDTASLEYDLTRIIVDLKRANTTEAREKTIVQYICGNSSSGVDYRYLEAWAAYAGFSLERETLPIASLNAKRNLLVLGSTDIDKTTAKAIENFINSGGNAVFFVSGNVIGIKSNWEARQNIDNPLLGVLSRQGFTLLPGLLMDVLNSRITLPALDNSRYTEIEYPFWVTVPRQGFTPDEPVFSGLSKLQFFWPSAFLIDQKNYPSVEPLARVTSRARLMVAPYDTNPFGKQASLLDAADSERNGSIKAAGVSVIAAKKAPGRIIVVADEYMPSQFVDYTGSDGNLDFAVSCLEWTSGEDRLLGLKARKSPDNSRALDSPGEEGPDTESLSNERNLNRARIVNLMIIPACLSLLLIAGIIRKKRNR